MTTPIFSIQISADTVAWYGAIVATGALLVSAYNAWRDRARIKIKYQKGMFIINAVSPYSEQKTYFVINIINTGRRPVSIGNVGIRLFKGGALLLSDSLTSVNRILTEEKPETQITTEQDLLDFSKVHYIEVYDKTGRQYRQYFHAFPTFKKVIYLIKNYGKK
ncbi:MAG TPA: hypothetical protein VNW06_06315 [Cytophagaceae bacterium]|jgi:hypothetical protein|nr:hypothetical protein [Cytophagaceae bacterium]